MKTIAWPCALGHHKECEGGEPDEIGDYGTRYGWNPCSCKCHMKKEKNKTKDQKEPS